MAIVFMHRLSICFYLRHPFSREFLRVLCALVVSYRGYQSNGMGRLDTVDSRLHFARPAPAIGL